MVTVRNDFGPTEEVHPSFFFREEEAFEEWESIALGQCGPRVLDIGAGAGAGAHALVLQARGHEVTALDLIPEAVRIMRERGVEDAREGTLFELPSEKLYDTVILLMNGSMIAETLRRLLEEYSGSRTWRLCAFRQGTTTRRSNATVRRRDVGSTAQPPCAPHHEGNDRTRWRVAVARPHLRCWSS